MSEDVPLTWNEALSGIAGSISLASWIFLLVPQLVENYQQRSASAISITFILIWFCGDIASLAGALWAGLVPTVLAIAVYFCISDTILLAQCTYYNTLSRDDSPSPAGANPNPNGAPLPGASESSPLLPTSSSSSRPKSNSVTDITTSNLGLPGSRRRSSGTSRRRPSSLLAPTPTDPLTAILEERRTPPSSRNLLRVAAKNLVCVLLIMAAGTAGWALAWKTGAWRPTPAPGSTPEGEGGAPLGAEILGYASAILYLGARIPQIVKNQRERSCDGLSLLFFLLSLMGNATYGAGILFHSLERGYVIKNLPWLIGSLGTMAEDGVIFVQFSVFGERNSEEQEEDGEGAVVD